MSRPRRSARAGGAPRRCPLCRLLSESYALRCSCGYQFGQSVADARAEVRQQLRSGVVLAAFGIVLIAAAVGIAVATYGSGTMIVVGTLGAGFTTVVRGVRMISRSRSSLHELRAPADRANAALDDRWSRPHP